MQTPLSRVDQLNDRLQRHISTEGLLLARNLSFGGAATCLIVLVGLAQVGAGGVALKISVLSASVALPMWLLRGIIYEIYIFLGKQSYQHLRSKFPTRFMNSLTMIAVFGSLGATGGVIWFLMPEAAWLFAAVVFLAAILLSIYQWFLARWWFGPGAPGTGEK